MLRQASLNIPPEAIDLLQKTVQRDEMQNMTMEERLEKKSPLLCCASETKGFYQNLNIWENLPSDRAWF